LKLDVIYNEDCLGGMKRLPDESIDLVYLDPPFGDTKIDKKINCYWEDIEDYLVFIEERLKEIKRLLKFNLFLHCDERNNYRIRFLLEKYFKFKNEIIWCYSIGQKSKRRLTNKHDTIYFYTKQGDKYNDLRLYDYWIAIRTQASMCGYFKDGEGNNQLLTPYQKPIKLLERIIKIGSRKNDIILDCFIGSGTTAVACKQLGRHYIGFEINPEYYEIAKKRLKEGI